jgi:hypothetical protein
LITAFEDLPSADACGLQRRQVALDQQPNTDHIDVPVIVPQPIPETPDFPPWNLRTELVGNVA